MIERKQQYDFSSEKNQQLIVERNVSFEEAIAAIEGGAILGILSHPNPAKYPNQEMYILKINNYVYVVPFVRTNQGGIFLKTIFPHRKLTKQFLKGDRCEKEKT